MTLDNVTDILNENPAVDAFSFKDDGVRFWVGVRAGKGSQQAAVDDVEAIDGVEVTREKTENGWRWYFASVEMGDRGARRPPEGQKCEREGYDEDAVCGIGNEWLCEEHQEELFAEWHG